MKTKSIYALIFTLLVMTLTGCTAKEPKLIDEANKTFYVNGVSAADGKDAVIKSLTDEGFEQDGEVRESDLSAIGEGFTYNAQFRANKLTDGQISTLTGGLFDNLKDTDKNYLQAEINEFGCRVALSWYKSGILKDAVIELGQLSQLKSEEDVTEVNKRLSQMFPKSKVSNSSQGFTTYYDENGTECYYTNELTITLEKKQ